MSPPNERASPRCSEWSPNARWKEWIPLITQQQRLRSVIQVLAYNVPWFPGRSLYFTLHQTAMSPPFYTSERVQHLHPKWAEIDTSNLPPSVNTSATGLVLRLWLHVGQELQDDAILVWGVYFSGLVYLGPRLLANTSHFHDNAVVLHMQGGYFTDRGSLKELPPNALVRYLSVMLPLFDTRPSYSVSLLLRLRNIQQAIRNLTNKSEMLQDKILAGGKSREDASISRESNPTIRKLLSKGRPKPQERKETLAVQRQVEMLRFRVSLLRQEKHHKLTQVELLEKQRDMVANDNADHSSDLMERYQHLHKEVEYLRDRKRHFAYIREVFLHKSNLLSTRTKQLMYQLGHIYPVTLTGGKYTIRGVHLPNSEELSNADDVSVSVALGFVAHLIQMVSIFLQVPLRYPIIHFGSRSKIIDHINAKIPDRDREFPLFSRGKDKLQFHYGVYLLNRNIAQLRWQVGFPTSDPRATLHNVYHLLHLNQFAVLESHHRSMSGSSLDVAESSLNVSPVGSVVSPTINSSQLRTRHRSSKSIGSTELPFVSSKRSGSYMSPPLSQLNVTDGLAVSSNLSCSLDQGLDEFGEMWTGDSIKSNSRISTAVPSPSTISYFGSEPNLVILDHMKSANGIKHSDKDLEPNSQLWEGERKTLTICSDDDEVSRLLPVTNMHDKSEFTLVTESLAKLVDGSQFFDAKEDSVEVQNQGAVTESFIKEPPQRVEQKCDPNTCDVLEKLDSGKRHCNFGPDCKKSFTETSEAKFLKPTCSQDSKIMCDSLDSKSARDEMEVDIGTDALASISNYKSHNQSELSNGSPLQSEYVAHCALSGSQRNCDTSQESEQNRMECVGVEESVLVDNLFDSVTSRTEALASHTASFNLMSSRHGST